MGHGNILPRPIRSARFNDKLSGSKNLLTYCPV